MKIATGETVYQLFLSLDTNNNPVTATTISFSTYKNSILYTGVTINSGIVDHSKGLFYYSWSADTTGDYQIYFRNSITSGTSISDAVLVRPDSEFQQKIYIGL